MSDQNATVLVVDDLETSRELTAGALRQQGYSVTLAENGGDALALVDKRPFELVLLDYRMPGMDGLEVLQAVRRTRSPADLPIIMVS